MPGRTHWLLGGEKFQAEPTGYQVEPVTSVVSAGSEINLLSVADDIALYRVVKGVEDYTQLQVDINSVSSCIEGKYLQFNAKKCRYMLISRKRAPIPYHLHA